MARLTLNHHDRSPPIEIHRMRGLGLCGEGLTEGVRDDTKSHASETTRCSPTLGTGGYLIEQVGGGSIMPLDQRSVDPPPPGSPSLDDGTTMHVAVVNRWSVLRIGALPPGRGVAPAYSRRSIETATKSAPLPGF